MRTRSTGRRTNRTQTLAQIVSARAHNEPGRLAFTFLANGESVSNRLTYGTLDAGARAVASALLKQNKRGERALLMLPSGPEFTTAFLGCLYSGVIAVPMPAPNAGHQRRQSRIAAIVQDAEPSVVLTIHALVRMIESLCASIGQAALRCIAVDAIDRRDTAPRVPRIAADDIAFIQYTSGSTATPRGVIVTHANLLHNETAIQQKCGQTADSTIVGWLPLFHDMGLVGNVLHPLFVGAQAVLMPPEAFLERPARWLEAITTFRGTTSGGPNFAYDLCVKRVSEQERHALDLATWTVAFNGAEPVRAATIQRFVSTYGPFGFCGDAFYPCYGLAECTLMAAGGSARTGASFFFVDRRALEENRVVPSAGNDSACVLTNCGSQMPDQILRIVDPVTNMATAAGQVGEIWVKGPSVAAGYWRKPEDTARVFGARLNGDGDGPFVRTGDLGFIADGDLYVTGRLKDVVIIRGRNHYAEDIEHTVMACHHSVQAGVAAFSMDVGGEEQLVVVAESERHADRDQDAIFGAIREHVVAVHEVAVDRVVLVSPNRIPRTSSGKVQRGACRLALIRGELQTLADSAIVVASIDPVRDAPAPEADAATMRSVLQRRICQLCAQVLRPPRLEVPPDVALATLGLDSLAATELIHAVKAECGHTLLPSLLLGGGTVDDLVVDIERGQRVAPPARTSGPTQVVEGPASWGQISLWFQQQLAPRGAAYNLARALRLRPSMDVSVLQNTLHEMALRHPALRTFVGVTNNTIVQRIAPGAALSIEDVDAGNLNDEELHRALASRAHLPFDLTQAPLWRATLFRRSGEDVLLIVAHHIIADLWSLDVFIDELFALHARGAGQNAEIPEASTLSYSDYVRLQREFVESQAGQEAASYWSTALRGGAFRAELPLDRARPAFRSFQGATLPLTIDPATARHVRAIARAHRVTVFVVLLAAFKVLLRRYSGTDDVIVGTPVNARPTAEFGRMIGYFVNPVPVRTQVAAALSFAELIAQVHRGVLGALDRQLYPQALLPALADVPRGNPHSPLFDVMFGLRSASSHADFSSALALGIDGPSRHIGSFEVNSVGVSMRTAQFDLSLFVADGGGALDGIFEYNTDLFDERTVKALGQQYCALLAAVVQEPSRTVADVLHTAAETAQLPGHSYGAVRQFPGPIGVHELIEQTVRRIPQRTAVSCGDRVLSYDELNRRANRLARVLRHYGVGPDARVGICLERSVAMVVSLLATLKAGGAYVPMDPEWPLERLHFVANDATATVVIADRSLADRVPVGTPVLWINPLTGVLDHHVGADLDDSDLRVEIAHNSLAYVIYTSGSTGTPKGAMNCHGPVKNRLLWMQEAYGLTEADRVLQKTPYSFDVSVWEFFWPLIAGAALVLARPGGHRDVVYLRKIIDTFRITTVHFVPSMLEVFLDRWPDGSGTTLRRVFVSGEALSSSLQRRFHAALPCELHNLYGPTESAIDVTFWPCRAISVDDPVPIGRPIANASVYVLDEALTPCRTGVTGELYLAGTPLARGYIGRAPLTAERFLPDPYASAAGQRMYRTGDLARWRDDGALIYVGRTDSQVKIRGNRVELGEVEAAILKHHSVREAVAVFDAATSRLIAYTVSHDGGSNVPADLESFLAASLPPYMVPSAFVPLTALPLSPNGKLDRRGLPAPSGVPANSDRKLAAPSNDIEALLLRTWSSVLGRDDISIRDDFFKIGGQSLFAAQIIARVSAELEIEIPLELLFQGEPTIVSLADRIATHLRPTNAV